MSTFKETPVVLLTIKEILPYFFRYFWAMQKFILFIFLIASPALLVAQSKKEKNEKAKTEEIEKPNISIDLDAEDTLTDVDLKVKKNTFYGEKTKKRWTVAEVQGRNQIEEFYVLKEAVEVDAYAPIVYVYDHDKRQIADAKSRAGLIENVLHGPYKRLINDVIVEEGMYFHGVKHERWLSLTRDQMLTDKEHYSKGWYRDSEITYYDAEKTKVKEVIPIQYGKKEGTYYYFYENGRVAVRGYYEFDKKVGVWTEYYNNTTRVIAKREIQFAPDPYQKHFRTYIRKESDRFANVLYESPKIK
ncbi:toxin-antitoxin system YwqK family antitoxin [Roseivirga seohaensis]|uniref:toxin-antitoxin system YwqK family antitoxin n=1 Tax=Roseivirga seohaensis TaxID=1914963 RepID=UPI003BAB19C5